MSDGAFNLPVAREAGSGRPNRLDNEGRVGFAGLGRTAGIGHEPSSEARSEQQPRRVDCGG
jgi:hypothetical protein